MLSSPIGVYIVIEDKIMREEQKEERNKYPIASFITNIILIAAAIIVISFFIEGITRHI